MPFVPVPNVAKCAMIFDLAGQLVVNTYHIRETVPLTEALLDGDNTALKDWWNNTLKLHFPTGMLLKQVTATDQASATGLSKTLSLSTPIAGTVSDSPMPNGTALVISHRTSQRGRNYRGRTYLGGVPLGYRTDSISIALANLTNYLSDFAALITALTALSKTLVVVSRFLNHVPRVTGISTPVTGFTGDTAWDSQRRRLLYRGK